MKPVGDLLKDKGHLERFKGFAKPNTTPTPDDIFDIWMPKLSHAELKVLLYITRRTFGFKRNSDRVSLSQICDGIVRKTGERLDDGAAVSRAQAKRVIKTLETKGLIVVERVQHEDGYNEVNVYSLRFREE